MTHNRCYGRQERIADARGKDRGFLWEPSRRRGRRYSNTWMGTEAFVAGNELRARGEPPITEGWAGEQPPRSIKKSNTKTNFIFMMFIEISGIRGRLQEEEKRLLCHLKEICANTGLQSTGNAPKQTAITALMWPLVRNAQGKARIKP